MVGLEGAQYLFVLLAERGASATAANLGLRLLLLTVPVLTSETGGGLGLDGLSASGALSASGGLAATTIMRRNVWFEVSDYDSLLVSRNCFAVQNEICARMPKK